MPSITLDIPELSLLKALEDASSKGVLLEEHILSLINSQASGYDGPTLSPLVEEDTLEIAKSILHMALRRPPDDDLSFFLVENLYSVLHGESSWKKRSTGNRIQIGRMFGKLVSTAAGTEFIDGTWKKIELLGKTPQNQAKYQTKVLT